LSKFAGKIAVVTGAGSGIGRALAQRLVAQGCHVAICDISQEPLEETVRLCKSNSADRGTRIVAHVVDVSDRMAVPRFRSDISRDLDIESIDLLINNAGIAGGPSFAKSSSEEWEKTFDVCWGGVYFMTREFFPLLHASKDSHIVNLSSVNGLWAALLPGRPHTAYSAAKFAVRGFTESLILDLRLNAPHIRCHLVMPGYVGTRILANTERVLDMSTSSGNRERHARALEWIGVLGGSLSQTDDAALASTIKRLDQFYESGGPLTPADAAETILAEVEAGNWRILVGEDAKIMDEMTRADPEVAYTNSFIQLMGLRIHAASTKRR
jgi:NAD(P)-dependent dehydrogenase (short-subunit alcohol dehydrogenase family)